MKTNPSVTSMTSNARRLVLALASLAFLAITTDVHAAAQKALTKRQIASIERQIPETEEVFEYANVGTLRNDAGTYFVASYETRADRLANEEEKQSTIGPHVSRCAIFGAQDDKLVLHAKSGPLIDYPGNGRDFVNCAIAKGNVEIHHSNRGGACSDFNEMWKFNLSDGRFILIGYDSISSFCEYPDESENLISTEIVTSINFLTTEAKLWRKAGESWPETGRWRRPSAIKKAAKYKEISVYFELGEPFVFELFDIEAFRAWKGRHKDFCGSIDEHYKYVPCRVSR
jgi:hypothetical protein